MLNVSGIYSVECSRSEERFLCKTCTCISVHAHLWAGFLCCKYWRSWWRSGPRQRSKAGQSTDNRQGCLAGQSIRNACLSYSSARAGSLGLRAFVSLSWTLHCRRCWWLLWTLFQCRFAALEQLCAFRRSSWRGAPLTDDFEKISAGFRKPSWTLGGILRWARSLPGERKQSLTVSEGSARAACYAGRRRQASETLRTGRR